MEAGGVGSWSGALVIATLPANGIYLTLEDIQRKAVLSDGTDSCTCPTKLIHLENPLGGLVMPLDELRRICDWAHANDIKVHLDGARLWEATVSGAGTIPEFCSAPDSVNLCLTKGLGGAVGSIVVGDQRFIKSAKWVKKTVGGAMRQPGFVAAAASAAVKHAWGGAVDGSESLLKPCHIHAARLADTWIRHGGRLLCPQGTNIIWLDLDYSGIEEEEWESRALERGMKLHCNRIIVHFRKCHSLAKTNLHYDDQWADS
jgi:threonine aldolase